MTTPTPTPAARSVDPDFLALPLSHLADAALSAARRGGASHAELRVERERQSDARVRDRRLEGAAEREAAGLSVRVLHDGTWGFAATTELATDAAVGAARDAVELARTSAALRRERIELADEPVYPAGTWISAYDVNPFDIVPAERAARLLQWTSALLAHPAVDHADAAVLAVQENKFYADLAGTTTVQQRVRVHPTATAVAVNQATGEFDTMRTLAPPTGRGWEYLTGTGWDWERELAELPELLAEKMAAPAVEAGAYDLVIDPSNLWLTIHESIGHATELDRALGYEAAYAGTSFATFDQLGTPAVRRPVHARDRRSHRPPRAGVGGLGRRGGGGPVLGPDPGRRPGWLPAGPAHGGPAGLGPVQRLRLRGLQQPRAPATDGERVAPADARGPQHGGADRRGRRGHLHHRRQELVDRHAALQLPVHRATLLPDPGRPAGGAAPRRRLPGHDHRILGRHGRRRAGSPPTCWAAPSTAARGSRARWRRSATAARRPCSDRCGC